MVIDKKPLALAQIDAALCKYEETANGLPANTALADDLTIELVTVMRAAVERLAPPGSAYLKTADNILGRYGAHHPTNLAGLAGVLRAMRSDYEAGYIQALHELIHGEVFGDFLEMADLLLGEGFKDPAAVIAGSVLEAHLRKLCSKNNLPVEKPHGAPKKASALNDDLKAANVYEALDHKTVTAWFDLRNKAAHGHYTQYAREQVTLMVQSLRDFLVRHPA